LGGDKHPFRRIEGELTLVRDWDGEFGKTTLSMINLEGGTGRCQTCLSESVIPQNNGKGVIEGMAGRTYLGNTWVKASRKYWEIGDENVAGIGVSEEDGGQLEKMAVSFEKKMEPTSGGEITIYEVRILHSNWRTRSRGPH